MRYINLHIAAYETDTPSTHTMVLAEEHDAEVAKLKELIEFQRKKLNQCAAIIYKHHPDLHDEIRAELKIYEAAE